MTNHLDHAIRYHEAGLKVIPAYERKGGGYTFCKDWRQYRDSQSREQVERLFSRPAWGLAILCTDGLEVIDIDTKHDPKGNIDKEYFQEVFWTSGDDTILPTCVTQKTKSGGWHLIYRTDKPDGNEKLTHRHGEQEAVIETRGEGGLIFAYPTPGYEVKRGSLTDIKHLSEENRNVLIASAKQLSDYTPAEPKRERKEASSLPVSGDVTPWDDYNNQHDVRDIIEAAGWTSCRGAHSDWDYYTRPGGTANTIHAAVSKERGIFYVFSTSTGFDSEKGYTAYAAYTVLEHSGNFSASAKALSAAGYGSRAEETKVADTVVDTPKGDKLTPLEYVMQTKFSISKHYEDIPATLKLRLDGVTYDVGGPGQIVCFTGPQKSGKTFLMSNAVAAGNAGTQKMAFQYQPGRGRRIWFDCEQPEKFYQLTQRRIYELSGWSNDPSQYEAYMLRRLSVEQRLAAIESVLSMDGEIELIVLDGIVDICKDFNDTQISSETVERVMQWTDKHNCLLFTVLHTAKAGWMKGHLGALLANKADTVIKSELNEGREVFEVRCADCRYGRFPMWEYSRDVNGNAVMDSMVEDYENEWEEPEKAYNPKLPSSVTASDEDVPFL